MKKKFGDLRTGRYFFCQHFGICVKTNQATISDPDSPFPQSRNAFALESRTPVFLSGESAVTVITRRSWVFFGDYIWIGAHTADQGGFGPFELESVVDVVEAWPAEFLPVRSGLVFSDNRMPVSALLLGDAWTFVHYDHLAHLQH